MEKTIICTVCPNGCEVTATYTNENDITLSGNRCKRGVEYCKNECFDPKRTFTSSVKIKGAGRRMLPVRTTAPISKQILLECAEVVHNIEVCAPIKRGDVICKNVLGTDANIIAAMTLEEVK